MRDKILPEKKYCISPWVEGVLRMNDKLGPCCKSPISLGVWKDGNIRSSWNSEIAIRLRKKIINGEFIDDYCQACYSNNTNNTPQKLLIKPLRDFCKLLKQQYLNNASFIKKIVLQVRFQIDYSNLMLLKKLFNKNTLDDEALNIISKFTKVLSRHKKLSKDSLEYSQVVNKLYVIVEIIKDFLSGNTVPKNIAPLRQANLIAICNARCIHCPGKYTGEIDKGLLGKDGQIFTQMGRTEIDCSFTADESIIDFFTNGSEFFLLKDWRYVADKLNSLSVKFRVSTNGMLLTKENVDYIVNNDLLGKFNISIDGASKEVLEHIRVRVKYDRLIKNIKYLLFSLEKSNLNIPISFSFCLMTLNYHQLADFVDFVADLIPVNSRIIPNIVIQPLSLRGTPEYMKFINSHHHTMIDKKLLDEKFKQLLQRSVALKIPVHVFYTHPIDEFVKRGCPLPSLDNARSVVYD